MNDPDVAEAPNLEALSAKHPRRKRRIVRLLWPKIRACLDQGHTVRDVHRMLKLDGLDVHYRNLCTCIAELRRRQASASANDWAPHGREGAAPKQVKSSQVQAPVDPLANVRRLTEEHRPGFHYPGTLLEKDLFGE
jgi:hypothetical protein